MVIIIASEFIPNMIVSFLAAFFTTGAEPFNAVVEIDFASPLLLLLLILVETDVSSVNEDEYGVWRAKKNNDKRFISVSVIGSPGRRADPDDDGDDGQCRDGVNVLFAH